MSPSALATDLYQLTMIAGYDAAGVEGTATFELFVRTLPPNRTFLVAAGLEQALDYLAGLHFTPDEIAWLRSLQTFNSVPARFFDETLRRLRFTGDVWAMPEGTPFFENEPILRITAPLIEAQLVETTLLAIINFQTLVASKAARVVLAADGRSVMEFGTRRAHGPDAALHAARAAYIVGCSATSNVEAGRRFGIPLAGTMAHAWVTSFSDEVEAFRAYAKVFGDRSVFLIDTYDTVAASRKVVQSGLRPYAVRIDSGDLISLSHEVRAVLDSGGLLDTRILASGDMDEWSIAELLSRRAPIDAFGVGTAISTSRDAPALGGVYKLVEIERGGVGIPVMKLSGGKATSPGRKQVWRRVLDGRAVGDIMGLESEAAPPDGRPLLVPVMRGGARVAAPETLDAIRQRHHALVHELPVPVLMLRARETYHVGRSHALEMLTDYTGQQLLNG